MSRIEFMSLIHAAMDSDKAKNVELMYLLMKKIHQGQVRKELDSDGEPPIYFEHLRRTALIALVEAGIVDDTIICTCLGHDSIEDSEETFLVTHMLERIWGQEVAKYIRILSKAPKVGYITRLNIWAEKEPNALIVKACDRLDNLRSLPTSDSAFCDRQRRETTEIYLPVFAKARAQLEANNSPFLSGFDIIINKIKELLV